MKTPLIFTFFIWLSVQAYSQEPKPVVKQLLSSSEVKLLGKIDSLVILKTQVFGVKIFWVGNPSGSANFEGGHEITRNLIFAVAENDESPVWKAFSVGPFYNPKIVVKKSHGSMFEVTIKYGGFKDRRSTKLVITPSLVNFSD